MVFRDGQEITIQVTKRKLSATGMRIEVNVFFNGMLYGRNIFTNGLQIYRPEIK